MGDKMFNISRSELDSHQKGMKEHLDANVLMMDRLFSIAENFQQKNEKLEIQLQEETKRRIELEEQLARTKSQLVEAENLGKELTLKLASVSEQLEKERNDFKKQLEEKDKTLKNMEKAVKEAEALLVGLKYLKRNVDAFRVGQDLLQEPCGACMLPDGRVIVADTLKGLFLFSHNTELMKHVQSNDWKWPQGLVYDVDMQQIVVTMRQKVDEDKWTRVIGFFDTNLAKQRTLLGPMSETGTDNTAKESLALTKDGSAFFLCVADGGTSTIYRLARGDTKWSQIMSKGGSSLMCLQVMASTGPITQLLALESRMANVQRLAVTENDVADKKTMAIVENPGALCVDQENNLFVYDKITGKIVVFDTFKFEKRFDLCLIDDSVFAMTASQGYLGVAVRGGKVVLIYRYKSDATALAAGED